MKRWAAWSAMLVALGVVYPLAVRSERRAGKAPAAVVGHLVLKGRKVTLKADGRVTVRTQEGKVLAENVTLGELRAIDPALQGMLERTMAAGKDGARWAGL